MKKTLHARSINFDTRLIIFHPPHNCSRYKPRIYSAKRGNLFAKLLKNRVGGDEQSNSEDKHEVMWQNVARARRRFVGRCVLKGKFRTP